MPCRLPRARGDLRTRPERYHDALEEAMRRLLASGLLPKRAGPAGKALVHMSFAELCDLDADSALQDKWIADYRARWAAHRAAASVGTGDGGAWLEGPAARRIACDAMIIPVVTGDIDPGAVEDLIGLCVQYDRPRQPTWAARAGLPGPDRRKRGPPDPAGRRAEAQALAELEQQILARVMQVVSGPGGVASFLRRNMLGQGLGGPSLPLDVGQTDDIPVHLRRLVALRDQGCGYPGGCDQPAAGCEPHHVHHRADGGPTSLTNLKDYAAGTTTCCCTSSAGPSPSTPTAPATSPAPTARPSAATAHPCPRVTTQPGKPQAKRRRSHQKV